MALEPTREAGLARLETFVPRMGRRYAEERGYDAGPERDNVSNLSPWIRRRLVLESEAAAAALDAHGAKTAEKFVQEVVWRTYWKGWLEQRPQVWDDYREEVSTELAKVERYRDQRARYETACAGETGIEPFDHWARELVETGTLHNHARMWFASIWIFTLELPWSLGADFFLHHLLDGNPASNTLSWRWVAGLHTAGKTYLATPENIARFTHGRFRVPKGTLATSATPPEVTPPDRHPLSRPEAVRDVPSVLLVTGEDCAPETLALPPITNAVLVPTRQRASEMVRTFERGALKDVGRRLGAAGIEDVRFVEPDDLGAALAGTEQVVGAELPVGPARDLLAATLADGPPFRPTRRPWDAKFWPHATAGYFKLKKSIPKVLRELESEGTFERAGDKSVRAA